MHTHLIIAEFKEYLEGKSLRLTFYLTLIAKIQSGVLSAQLE